MTIDWITVAAQVVNFLILVWLLQRFLYRPIVRAMDRREAGIAERIDAADARVGEADAAVEDFRARSADLEAQCEALLEDARRSAGEERLRLIAEAAREVDEERRLWREALDSDRTEFLEAVRGVAAREACAVARSALHDLAHADLEPRIVTTFLDHLEELDGEERAQIAASADGLLVVQTPVELADQLRDELRRALRAIAGGEARVAFETNPEMALGVVVTAGSRTVTWTIDGYLRELERRLSAELEELTPRAQ